MSRYGTRTVPYKHNTSFHQYIYCRGGRHLLWSYDPSKITVLDTRNPTGIHDHGCQMGDFDESVLDEVEVYCPHRYIYPRVRGR